jgi:hypothetical protein
MAFSFEVRDVMIRLKHLFSPYHENNKENYIKSVCYTLEGVGLA